MKKFFDSEAWKWIRALLEILLIVGMILVIITVIQDFGLAEDDYSNCEEIYVLCSRSGYVTLRSAPRKNGIPFGGASCGAKLKTDGKRKNGFIHIVDVAAEESSGWISEEFIVHDEPELLEQNAFVVSIGRLAARKNIGGKVRRWLKPMTEVFIIYRTEEWCLTNCGYVRTQFLELKGE